MKDGEFSQPVFRNRSEQEMTEQVATAIVNKADDGKARIIELEKRYKAAAEFLDEATNSVKASWLQWMDDSKKYLDETRMWRMAMEKEAKDGTRACRDMLDFLGTQDTKEKLKTLRELVEIAERMKALKESGFFDSMIEAMLKSK